MSGRPTKIAGPTEKQMRDAEHGYRPELVSVDIRLVYDSGKSLHYSTTVPRDRLDFEIGWSRPPMRHWECEWMPRVWDLSLQIRDDLEACVVLGEAKRKKSPTKPKPRPKPKKKGRGVSR